LTRKTYEEKEAAHSIYKQIAIIVIMLIISNPVPVGKRTPSWAHRKSLQKNNEGRA